MYGGVIILIRELIEKQRYSFYEGFDNWEDAIIHACKPLVMQNAIQDVYPELIIESIKKHGAYIVIAPNIAIPHAQEKVGVNETCVSFMKTEKPVKFDDNPEHNAQIFFVLASTDNEKHLENLCELVEFLDDKNIVEKLENAKNKDDLEAIFSVHKVWI